jgi:hypothetical protein
VRRIVREELAAFFEPRVAELKSEPQAGTAASRPETEPTPTALKGVSPSDEQILSSLNSLASPSQHPELSERSPAMA